MTPYSKANFYLDSFPVNQFTEMQCLFYLPKGFDSSKKYSFLIFFPGVGENGTDVTKMFIHGPFKFIGSSWNPDFGILAITGGAWDQNQFNFMLPYIIKKLPIDPSKIFLTGLSAGGGTVESYIGLGDSQAKGIAGIFPASAAVNPTSEMASEIVKNNIVLVGFGDPIGDLWGQKTKELINYVNALKSGAGIFISRPVGHGGWDNDFYDPSIKIPEIGNLSLYDYIKQIESSITFSQSVSSSILVTNPTIPESNTSSAPVVIPEAPIQTNRKVISITLHFNDGTSQTINP